MAYKSLVMPFDGAPAIVRKTAGDLIQGDASGDMGNFRRRNLLKIREVTRSLKGHVSWVFIAVSTHWAIMTSKQP